MVNQPCLPSGFTGQLLSKYLRGEGERQAGGIRIRAEPVEVAFTFLRELAVGGCQLVMAA